VSATICLRCFKEGQRTSFSQQLTVTAWTLGRISSAKPRWLSPRLRRQRRNSSPKVACIEGVFNVMRRTVRMEAHRRQEEKCESAHIPWLDFAARNIYDVRRYV
jgi:hypothetical protein